MIQRLGGSSISFKAGELQSGRSAYNFQLDKNKKTAQVQNDMTMGLPQAMNNTQIAMQGQTQNSKSKNLDVIA